MTNFQRWKQYFANIHAPAQFIEAGFYFTISAALERRVWVSSGAARIFANQYVLLVGPAGVGKGLVTGVVDYVLRENTKPNTEESIIRLGPVSGSYQHIVKTMAEKSELIQYSENGKMIAYPYASCCCVLDEFTSFFNEHAGDAVTFFCQAWTGNIPYESGTISRGRTFVKNPSLSLIGGTTPSNFQKLQKHDIVGTGLDRRLLIVFAPENEWRQFEIPPHTEEQLASMTIILQHVLLLSKVCGGLVYSQEARDYLTDWWAKPSNCMVSNHYMLRDYHPNKNSLLHKLCIARHMSEGEPARQMKLPITLAEVQDSIRMLMSYERLRASAWSESGQNLLYPVAMRIAGWLRDNGAASRATIVRQFFAEAMEDELDKILSYLNTSGRVRLDATDPCNIMYVANNEVV